MGTGVLLSECIERRKIGNVINKDCTGKGMGGV